MGLIAARARRRQAVKLLSPPRTVEDAYVRALRGKMRTLHSEAVRHLGLRQDAAQVPGDFRAFVEHMAKLLAVQITPAFDEMVRRVVAANDRGLRALGVDLRQVIGLEAVITHFREENVNLMVRAGRSYADDVMKVMSAPDAWGMRVEELAARIAERGDVSESRAELIARDQTLKMNGQVNRCRQQGAGVEKYIWSTSLDERVREEHRALEGQTFAWNAPPSVGHPGEDIQCRCVPLPVLPALED